MREVPSGAVNGTNTTFLLSRAPVPGTLYLYLNGLLLEEGAAADYTLSGATTIILAAAPLAGDKLDATYRLPATADVPDPQAGIGLDLSRDYLIIDDPEALIFRSKTGASSFSADYTVQWCQREEEVKTGQGSGADLRVRETFWTLWRRPLDAAGFIGEPKRHDMVVHGSRQYVVMAVENQDKDRSLVPQRFRLACTET